MKLTTIQISPKQPFNFSNTVNSHGWVELEPNFFENDTKTLCRVEKLSSGKIVLLRITGNNDYKNPVITIECEKVNPTEEKEIKTKVEHILRIDEDFSEFYKLCNAAGDEWKALTKGMGRLMRSPSLWEDIVKTICTTNVQWGGTIGMLKRFVEFYGEPYPGNKKLKCFPTPEKISGTVLKKFNEKVRMGYRSEYVHLLAKQFVKKEIDLNKFTNRELTTEQIKKDLLKIKGIGNYAAATLLMILGRYDEIPVDTVFRDFIKTKYFMGDYPSDTKALEIYDKWGDKKFLAYWFDLWQFYHKNI